METNNKYMQQKQNRNNYTQVNVMYWQIIIIIIILKIME